MKPRIKLLFVIISLLTLSPSSARAVNMGSISSAGLTAMIRECPASVVVVNFWTTWCGPCRKEIPGLIELREEFSESDLAILGISLDFNANTVTAFDKKMGINYPVYIAGEEVMRDFEVSAVPKLMVYNKGRLVEEHEGHMPTRSLRKLIERVLAGAVEEENQ